MSDLCAEGFPALLDLEMRALLPSQRTVLVSAGSLPPALTKAFTALDYENIYSLPSRISGQYASGWWRTGCRDEPEAFSNLFIWVSPDLQSHPALRNPLPDFSNNLLSAMEGYTLPPRDRDGFRQAPIPARWASYLLHTDSGWVASAPAPGWVAATDGSVRSAQAATDDSPYAPVSMGAGLLLARPGAMGPDTYNFSRTRIPGVRPAQNGRGDSRGDASFSIRVLGDASCMRAELGAILCALDLTPWMRNSPFSPIL